MAASHGRSQQWPWLLLSVVLLFGAWLISESQPAPTCPPEGLYAGRAATAAAAVAAGGPAAAGDTVHTIFTSNGNNYLNFDADQTLALYGTWRLAQRMRPGGDKMVALTRILHRSQDDVLSPYVPTFRAQPLHPECSGDMGGVCNYPVADRANAVRQFIEAADRTPGLIQAPWLYLIETDFLFARPVAAPGPADSDVKPLAFYYSYIYPEAKVLKDVMPRFYPPGMGNLSDIPRTGPSPVLARLWEWKRVLPRWEGLTAQIEGDREFVSRVLWVREMFAFSIAVAVERLELTLEHSHNGTLIVQPPVDLRLGNASAMHYTWGPKLVFASNGSIHWQFEKRKHNAVDLNNLTFVPLPPPYVPGLYVTPSGRVGPKGAPTSLEDYNLIKFEAQLFNRGLEEVGGKRWKEVLGSEAAAAQAAAAAASGRHAGLAAMEAAAARAGTGPEAMQQGHGSGGA